MSEINYETEFQGKENICNWCGNKDIKRVDRVFGCDLWHDVFECQQCKKFTWLHIFWSKCEKLLDGKYIGR